MKRYNLFCHLIRVSFFVLCLYSCVKQEQVIPDEVADNTVQTESEISDLIPLDEALSNLEAQMMVFYGNTTTKADISGKISNASVDVLTKTILQRVDTKGEASDFPQNILYLVNFKGSEGFAILSASKKLNNNVFCITESGSIAREDFLSAYQRLNNDSIYEGGICSDGPIIVPELLLSEIMLELEFGVKETEEEDDNDGEDYEEEEDTKAAPPGTLYGPYVKTKWGQTRINSTRVWNRYTPNNACAGCVVIATAQIMVYRKLSNSNVFDGVTCSWNGMETVYKYTTLGVAEDTTYYDQAAHFVRELGKSNKCNISYGGSDGAQSSGYAEGAQRALQYYGYTDVDKHLGFGKHNQKIATRVIRNGKPVYLDGLKSGLFNDGHAWVLDGECGDYYHINWGWNGESDGYYRKGTFSTTDRYSRDSVYDTESEQQLGRNYTWDYRLVTYAGAVNTN